MCEAESEVESGLRQMRRNSHIRLVLASSPVPVSELIDENVPVTIPATNASVSRGS